MHIQTKRHTSINFNCTIELEDAAEALTRYINIYRFVASCAALGLAAGYAGAQTRVDLRTQSKSADFAAASSTKPFQTGTALPSTCSQGQTFFQTNAPAGANFYACISTNTWALESGNAGLSYLTTNTEGSLSNGRRIAAGTGIGPFVDTGPAGTLIIPLDTAVALTKVTAQAGAPWSLTPAGASGTGYSAAASPTLTAYTRNQFFSFIPDVNCGVSPTLTIDGLGPIALKKISGGALSALTTNDCLAGVPYQIRAHGNPVDSFVLSTDIGTPPGFGLLTGGTNNGAAMIVGPGASLTVSGSGAINSTSLGGSSASITAYGAVGNGSANNNSAVSAAFAAAAASGSAVYIPAAASFYKIDNSAGPLVITGFTGRIYGDGKASLFACTTLANDCLKFSSASNAVLENFSLKYTPATTTRNGAQLLTIDAGSNVTLNNLELFNGNSSGLFINKSDKISTRRIYVHDMLANGVFLTNSSNSSIDQTIGNGNGDALIETSFFDSQVHACDTITITDVVSTGDVTGLLINGCTNVTASNLAITGSTGAGIYVRQDSSTTTAHWPDGTIINGAVIYGAALQSVLISADTSASTAWTVSLSNIVSRTSTGGGIAVASSTPINSYLQLNLDNVIVDGTAGTSVGYRFNGKEVIGSNLTARRTGLYSFLDEGAAKLTLNHIVSENPNQNASDNRAVVLISTGYALLNGVTLIDTQATERSNIDDVSASGIHQVNGISTSIANAGFAITSSNAGSVFLQIAKQLPTGAGPYLASAASIPSNGCASWSSGQIGSTGSGCGGGDVSTATNATFGAHDYDFSGASSVSLPAPWVDTASAHTYTLGKKQTFGASSTIAGFNLVGTADPSTPAAGDCWMSLAGSPRCYDGSAVRELTNTTLSNLIAGSVQTAGLAANAVTSAKMSAVNTRRTNCLTIGANNGPALADTDLGPRARQYFVNAPYTLVEVEVAADAGTPRIIVGRSHAGSISNVTSAALATASNGGIACANGGGTTGIDGVTTCSNTLQNTAFAVGDWITLVSGTAGGTAKEMTVCFTFTVN
jgi:hypothetical protein